MLRGPEAGGLPASEGRVCVGVRRRRIPLEDAGLRGSLKRLAPGARSREERGDESLPHAVREPEGFIETRCPFEHEDRAERLLLHDRALVRRADDDGRGVPGSRPARREGVGRDQARSAGGRARERGGDPVARFLGHERTDARRRVEGIAPGQRRRRRGEKLEKRVKEAILHDGAPVRRTALARELERSLNQQARRAPQIRAFPDDRGVVASQLRLERDPTAGTNFLRRPASHGGAR